jgi:uncharacterized protein YjiS (DUF1127 family)
MFHQDKSRDIAITSLHGCVAARRIVQAQQEAHVSAIEEAEPTRHPVKRTEADIMATLNATRTPALGLAERLTLALSAVKSAYRKHTLYRQTRRELQALSHRELNDLGIHASMIERIAHEAAYGK